MCLKKKVKQWMLKYSKKSLRVCVSVLMFVVVCREGMKKRKVNITIIRIFVYSAHCCQKILQCIRICIFNKNETTGKFQLNGGFSFMHKCIVNVWNIIFKLDKREISSISWTCTITLECLKHTHTHTQKYLKFLFSGSWSHKQNIMIPVSKQQQNFVKQEIQTLLIL